MERSGMSPRTIEYVHAIIRSALNYAVKQEMIASNPASRCDLPKKIRKEKEVLTLDQAKKFIENSRQVKNGIICEFMLLTGLRPSECLGLKWADVDFVNSTVSIVRGVTHRTDGTGGFDFHPTKTKRSNRKLPLSPNLVNILKRHKRTQNEQIIASGGGYSRLDLVFATDIGTPLRQRNVRTRVFDKILTNTGIDGKLSPYSLRHSFATLMLTNNENLKVIQEYLGHSSIAITADTYSHVTSMMKKEASDNLQALLGNSI
jgi:integrase